MPCCEKVGLKKGPWTPEEDKKLMAYVEKHGHGNWRSGPAKACCVGLYDRCCRLVPESGYTILNLYCSFVMFIGASLEHLLR
ncbi:hypothetical protein JHK87_003647 [Glycine soja]|nr:hypothetical protein JHK87_003647 [Glycine soja]